jgi:protein EFR3
MSSLLNPIHSAKQKCRPKHQVLVLKCYPKYQKTVQEVKPMSSELSYLLYYVSTRRNKLQKVGAFLEKKNAGDVWKRRLGCVQQCSCWPFY